jgi:hypothetical protein
VKVKSYNDLFGIIFGHSSLVSEILNHHIRTARKGIPKEMLGAVLDAQPQRIEMLLSRLP